MKTRMTGLLAVALASIAAGSLAGPISGQGTWETTLQARDLDGNAANGPEAFYDTSLNITWLRNGSQYTMGWSEAKSWAETSSFFGLSGWRLPTTPAVSCDWSRGGTGCSNSPGSLEAKRSEMAHLFFMSLGNKAYYSVDGSSQSGWGLSNTGDFENLTAQHYWSGIEVALNSGPGAIAWDFITGGSFGTLFWQGYNFNALAVRDGDVFAVPEPQTCALVLAGLGLVAGVTRRRSKQQ